MCTVTFIPQGNTDFVLTSNRDEAPNRRSLPPRIYNLNGVRIMFPKDELAGGTWIGTSGKNRVLCVLNGGFEFHKRKESYRLSRGIVVKDILVSDNLEESISNYNLEDVEPFTLVIVDWSSDLKLFELVWDGSVKHFKMLPLEPTIWSSSTLYTKGMKKERSQWFADFKSANKLNSETLIKFHNRYDASNLDYGIIMDRGFVKTTSITQVQKVQNEILMSFTNLDTKNTSVQSFNILHAVNE